MNENKLRMARNLTNSGIALVVIQLFRLLFGGYLIGLDYFYYNDLESALTVFFIYIVVGSFTALFLLGKKKHGLLGLIILSVILIIMQSVYILVYFSQSVPDPSWHSPTDTWWATISNFLFPLLTLILAIKIMKSQSEIMKTDF